jgi:hypothetical protein
VSHNKINQTKPEEPKGKVVWEDLKGRNQKCTLSFARGSAGLKTPVVQNKP